MFEREASSTFKGCIKLTGYSRSKLLPHLKIEILALVATVQLNRFLAHYP